MKSVNLNVNLKDLEGKDVEGQIIGKIVANVIATESKGDALKIFGWAVEMTKGNCLLLDKSDFSMFKEIVNSNERLTILVKAQVLEILDSVKDE